MTSRERQIKFYVILMCIGVAISLIVFVVSGLAKQYFLLLCETIYSMLTAFYNTSFTQKIAILGGSCLSIGVVGFLNLSAIEKED